MSGYAHQNTPAGTSFYLVPANPRVSVRDFEFLEYAALARDALVSQGYVAAPSADAAKLGILLAYGIGDPRTSAVTTTTTQPDPNAAWQMPAQSWSQTHTTHFRYASFHAIDLVRYRAQLAAGESDPTPEMVWQLEVQSRGTSSDLRQVFPILLKAAAPYFGRNTGQAISFEIVDDSSW
ncbi:MAG: hypothetical protein AB7O54_11590 [Pseudomonadales bacterium]